jgi:acetolactate synthase-1/2/3 large subunit
MLNLLDLSCPTKGFVKLANGMEVAARRVNTAEQCADARRDAFTERAPAPD